MTPKGNFNEKFSKISPQSVSVSKKSKQTRYAEQPEYINFRDSNGVEYAFLGMTDDEIDKCQGKMFYPFKMIIPRSFQLVMVDQLAERLKPGVVIDTKGALYDGKPRESVMLNVCLNVNDRPIQITTGEEDERKPFHPCDVITPLKKGGGICAHHVGTIDTWGDPTAKAQEQRKTKYKLLLFYIDMEDIIHDDACDREGHDSPGRYPRTHPVATKMEYYFGTAPGYFFIPVQKPDGAVAYFGMPNNGSDKTRQSLSHWITEMNKFHPVRKASVQIDDWLFIPVDQWSVFICRDAKLIIE